MKINNYYKDTLGSSIEKFGDFLKEISKESNLDIYTDSDIDYLSKRIAQNMFYFEDNINTAKNDYILLLQILYKKGIILKDK
jgi:deoxyadenosine/deoxycytidine kinase